MREKLLEAVENLTNALKEAQKAKGLDERKEYLNACRRYIDRTCELLDSAEKKTPGAARAIRRGLPIIDERIKEILAEIQENATALCRQTKGTPFDKLGREINNIGSILLQVRDPIGLDKNISNLHVVLSAICEKFPEYDKGEACELIKKLKNEHELEDKLAIINMIVGKISSQMVKIDMSKIEIKNSQIAIGNGNIQKMELPIEIKNDGRKSGKKSGIFELINLSAIATILSGFGTYVISETLDVIPVTEKKHLINAVLAIVVFFIILFAMRKFTKK